MSSREDWESRTVLEARRLHKEYPGASGPVRVLCGVDLAVGAGETISIVGASGAGKSTLASLVPRLYDVTSGAVRVDGIDVRDLTLATLRRPAGVMVAGRWYPGRWLRLQLEVLRTTR